MYFIKKLVCVESTGYKKCIFHSLNELKFEKFSKISECSGATSDYALCNISKTHKLCYGTGCVCPSLMAPRNKNHEFQTNFFVMESNKIRLSSVKLKIHLSSRC